VAAHGQGGVGKTTMAAAVVRDSAVRDAFDRIGTVYASFFNTRESACTDLNSCLLFEGWVSVGQTPAVMELQRVLYHQLTGEVMPVVDGATAATQLTDLQATCIGQRWLVILDDVWDQEHENQLSCVDAASPSKLLVTTRIRYSCVSFLFSTSALTHLQRSVERLRRGVAEFARAKRGDGLAFAHR
jgi:hypothetical protein